MSSRSILHCRLTIAFMIVWLTSSLDAVAAGRSTLAADLIGDVGCAAATRGEVFDSFYRAQEEQAVSSTDSFKEELRNEIGRNEQLANAPPEQVKGLKDAVEAIHRLMTEDVQLIRNRRIAEHSVSEAVSMDEEEPAESEDDEYLHLIRLEMGSEIDRSYPQLNGRLDAALAEARMVASWLGLECQPTPPSETAIALKNAVVGARLAMATVYQSCQSLDLPPVGRNVEQVLGVVRDQKIDEVGWGRRYTDVALLKRTHFYHRGQTYGPSCMNQDAKPLVYDYGGKPVAKTSQGMLDFFSNNGGGPALGVDCSAYISTAVGVAGQRYRPGVGNKAVYTRFVSRDFINPSRSGWACYDSVRVSFDGSIRPGDIAAVEGHVLMIDEIGPDPFGLAAIKSVKQCGEVTTDRFDFTVIQSSSSKGHLGVNRQTAKDYLVSGGKMAKMFLGYAKQACRSFFDKSVRKPSTSTYGIIRHKRTPECLAPRLTLIGEGCTQSCSGL